MTMTRDPESSITEARIRHRPPVLAITFFILFSLLLLFFITYRQFRDGESDRLRMLAGLSSRVENTIEDLAERFVRPVRTAETIPNQGATGGATDSADKFLGAVPLFQRLSTPLKKQSRDTAGYPVEMQTQGSRIFLTYKAQTKKQFFADQKGFQCDPSVPSDSVCHYSVEVDLVSILESIQPPDGFDALYLSTLEGGVLYTVGEPELRVTNLLPLLTTTDSQSDSSSPSTEENPTNAGPLQTLPTTATALNATLAHVRYRAFFQPMSIDLPLLDGEALGQPIIWVAVGLVEESTLLASSYTSSPVLLFGLIAAFPLAILAWPFVKLVLITKRQRFTRFDVGALSFATVFGLSMLTFLVFGVAFIFTLQGEIDTQLDELSKSIEERFRLEVEDISCQVAMVDQPLPGLIQESLRYPMYNTLFWIDSKGIQQDKQPLLDKSVFDVNVEDRAYFRCAATEHRDSDPQSFQVAATSDRTCRVNIYRKCEGLQCLKPLCLQSILSRITGVDEAIIATASDGDSSRVVAIATSLQSLANPVLLEGFGFAIVDQAGLVQFHSDRHRNLAEDFLKASNEDRILESVLRDRRKGYLDIKYWGEPHRVYVRPLRGLDWSLVTFSSSRALRMRAFALVHDFTNPFLLYLVLVVGVLAVAVFFLSRDYLENLWPSSRFTPVYRHMVLVTLVLVSAFAMLLSFGNVGCIYLFSTFVPILGLVYFVVRLRIRETKFEKRPTKQELDAHDTSSENQLVSNDRRAPASDVPYLLVGLFMILTVVGADEARAGLNKALSGSLTFMILALSMAVLTAVAMLRSARHEIVPIARREEAIVLAWLIALMGFLVRVSPMIGFLVVVMAFAVTCFELEQLRFFFRQRRFAFLFCWSGLLFLIGIVPALGFVSLAISRQTQLAVVHAQVGAAAAIEKRDQALERTDEEIEHRLGVESLKAERDRRTELYYGTELEEIKTAYRNSFFPNPEKPEQGARFSWAQATTDDDAGVIGKFVANLLASRFIALNDFAHSATDVDLSRFHTESGTWQTYPDRIVGLVPTLHGLGPSTEIVSRFPDEWPPIRIAPDFASVVWAAFLLFLAAMPILLANVIAKRVLLIALVQSASNGGAWTVDDLLDKAKSGGPKRTLLITRFPDGAAQRAGAAGWVVRQYSELVSPAKRPAAWPLISSDPRQANAPHENAILFVTDFHPNVDGTEEARSQIARFGASLSTWTSVIVASQSGPAELFEHEQGDLSAARNRLISRWTSVLAAYDVRHAVDAGMSAPHYRLKVQEIINESHVLEVRPGRLARLIARECARHGGSRKSGSKL